MIVVRFRTSMDGDYMDVTFKSQKELLAYNRITWRYDKDDFVGLGIHDSPRDSAIMEVCDEGRFWWFVGRIIEGRDELDLPKFSIENDIARLT